MNLEDLRKDKSNLATVVGNLIYEFEKKYDVEVDVEWTEISLNRRILNIKVVI